jgi:hypothetical protein
MISVRMLNPAFPIWNAFGHAIGENCGIQPSPRAYMRA